jgi:hypothetical protein
MFIIHGNGNRRAKGGGGATNMIKNFYFQFYFNMLDLNIEPKLNINKIGLIKI